MSRALRAKYKNIKTNGYASGKEAAWARKLNLLRGASDPAERVVLIQEQRRYLLIPSQRGAGRVIERPCHYIADFYVEYADGRTEVIDAKGARTKDYVIKRKLMLHIHGIRIREV